MTLDWMHHRLRVAAWLVGCWIGVSGCGTETTTTRVACAADGTCPGGTQCVSGICEPGAPKAGPAADAGAGGGADAGAAGYAGGGAGGDVAAAACEADPSGGPSARGDMGGGYAGGKLWVMAGDEGAPIQCQSNPQMATDAHVFDPCKGWTPAAGTVPPPRARSANAWDRDGDALWLFGGRFRAGKSGNYTNFGDLWRLDGASGQWDQIDDGSAGGPKPRSNAAAAWRRQTKTLYVHGGNTSANGLNFIPQGDLWAFDSNAAAWSQVKTSGGPSARLFHAMAVTDDGKYLVVYGGGGADAFTGPFYGDTWRLDLDTLQWQKLGSGPKARIKTGLVAVAGSPALWLFGGHDDGAVGNRNDLWTLDAGQGKWAILRAGDLGLGENPDVPFAQPKGFCDFPPDFMQIDKQSPERREAFLFAPDAKGNIWLVGGKSDCGVLRDVWRLDTGDASWHEVDDTTTGWSCERFQTPCNTLCN